MRSDTEKDNVEQSTTGQSAVPVPGQGTVPGPDQATPHEPAQGTVPGPDQGPAKPGPGQDTVPGLGQSTAPGLGPSTAKSGSGQGTVPGSGQSTVPGPGQGTPFGPGQRTVPGQGQGTVKSGSVIESEGEKSEKVAKMATAVMAQGKDCPVCADPFRDPRALDCGHYFCFSCLEFMTSSTGDAARISCPSCRQVTTSKVTDLAKVPQDEFRSKTAAFLSGGRETVERWCDLCIPQRRAVRSCFQCRLCLCDKCVLNHKPAEETLKHRVSRISALQFCTGYHGNQESSQGSNHSNQESSQGSNHSNQETNQGSNHGNQESNQGSNHSNQYVIGACMECKTSFCSLCFPQHVKHEYEEMQVLGNIAREHLSQDVLRNVSVEGDTALGKTVSEVRERLAAESSSLKAVVGDIKQAIAELLQRLETLEKRCREEITSEIKELDMMAADVGDFIQTKKSLIEHIDDLTKNGSDPEVIARANQFPRYSTSSCQQLCQKKSYMLPDLTNLSQASEYVKNASKNCSVTFTNVKFSYAQGSTETAGEGSGENKGKDGPETIVKIFTVKSYKGVAPGQSSSSSSPGTSSGSGGEPGTNNTGPPSGRKRKHDEDGKGNKKHWQKQGKKKQSHDGYHGKPHAGYYGNRDGRYRK